ncbi:hypothetical protein KFU94_36760 [Chloroflexi bacterium TSY]|nr:hypothetical protein [Chloroflexi bacterium TSY]
MHETTHTRTVSMTLTLSYRAYLVRLWQDEPDKPWRASAQSVQSGEVVRFASLQALFAFLETETVNQAETTLPERG